MQNPKYSSRHPALLTLLLLVSFASSSALLITPALPEMADSFHVSSTSIQLVMSLFLLGYALGQLPYGFLANRLGRKPVLYLGLIIAVIASLLSAFTLFFGAFWFLVFLRFITALGACVGLKMTFTIIGDCFGEQEAAKASTWILLSFAIAPGIAAAIGGFLTAHFDWKSCFYFLALYGVLLFVLSIFLPETARTLDQRPLRVKNIFLDYVHTLKDLRLVLCSLLLGAGTSVFYIFGTWSPFIGIHLIKLSPDQYGSLNLLPPIGIIVGSLSARKMIGKKQPFYVIAAGITCIAIGSFAMLLLFSFNILNWASLFLPTTLIFAGCSLIYTNATSVAITRAKDKSNASAIMNFINVGLSFLFVLFAQWITPEKAFFMPLIFMILVLFEVILLLFLKKESLI